MLSTQSDGQTKVEAVESQGKSVIKHTGAPGRETIEREVGTIQRDWECYTNQLQDVNSQLNDALAKWDQYERTYQMLQQWVKDTESKVKDVPLVATLEEKRAQVAKYKVSVVKRVMCLIHLAVHASFCQAHPFQCQSHRFSELFFYGLKTFGCGIYIYVLLS